MNKLRSIPCLPGWITALGIGLLALVPTYAYVRILPLGIGAIIAVYCLIGTFQKKHPEGTRVVRALFTTLMILGVTLFCVTGGLILHSSLSSPAPDCEYIVVLGAQVRDDGPSMSLWERIVAAKEYLEENPDTVAIVSGGQGGDEPMTEAQCMYDELIKLGIPAERLRKEENATSTWGNLTYSLDIIETETGERPTSVGVVSSEYHLFRTGLQAEGLGLEISAIPAKTGSFDRFLHYYVREVFGVWHYILLGGQNR